MDNKTLSLHGGKTASLAHNRREQGKEGKYSTIKNELTENNVTLIDIDIKEAYKQLFSEAVDDYNKTQKRSDRKIKNYYSKIHNDKKKNTHYEYIFQLGNIKNRIDDDTFIAVCSDYVASFQERNPNLYLIGAYIHLDEEASPHMHIDYIPVGHYDKGMRLQASSNKAFEELTNYKSQSKRDTAQIKWQESEREYIKSFCRDYGIEVIDGDSKGKKSLSIAEFKAQKDMEQAKLAQQQAEQEIRDIQTRIKVERKKAKREIKNIQTEIDDMKSQQDSMAQELEDATNRFNKIKHEMNEDFRIHKDRLDEYKDTVEKEIHKINEAIEFWQEEQKSIGIPVYDRNIQKATEQKDKFQDLLDELER